MLSAKSEEQPPLLRSESVIEQGEFFSPSCVPKVVSLPPSWLDFFRILLRRRRHLLAFWALCVFLSPAVQVARGFIVGLRRSYYLDLRGTGEKLAIRLVGRSGHQFRPRGLLQRYTLPCIKTFPEVCPGLVTHPDGTGTSVSTGATYASKPAKAQARASHILM